MFWPILALLALAAIAVVHVCWKSRFDEAQAVSRREMDEAVRALKRTEHEIQARQATLFDSMSEGLLLLNESGHIQLANRAFNGFFGVTGDIRSRTIIEALRSHELAEIVESVGSHAVSRELKLSRPGERVLQVNAASVQDGESRRYGTIIVFHDLTRLKQLERARQEFVANVSHELRTPLSLIKGYVETLLDGAKDNPEVATKFLATIDRNAERLKLLIEDLLTISELESGRMKLNVQSVALPQVMEKVLTDFKARTLAKQINLRNEAPELRVRADSHRLEQVLTNLIDNAIKYGRSEGTVTLGARPVENEHVEVWVSDDGPGIPADSLERVFERFYRVDKARSREQGGTGLGLSIVKHIVQSHGGRVWAVSEPGKGASFHFTLAADSGGLQQPLL